jgi:TM2 domain
MADIGGIFESTTLKRWKAQLLDYNFYWAFAAFLGWFGVDYWYLGAPLIGLLKMIINTSTFGYWWFYDMLNATFNRPTVELFGPTIPLYGPSGCGGGRFRQEGGSAPQKELDKHLNYIIYGLVLGFVGIIGGDSYILGNTDYAYVRLLSFISIIGIPVAIIWWAINVFNYVFNVDYFMNDASKFLGCPRLSGEDCPSLFVRLFIIPLQFLFGTLLGPLFGFNLPLFMKPLETWQQTLLMKPVLTPDNINKYSSHTPEYLTAEKPSLPMTGGSLSETNTHLLSLLFAGTIGFIIVSSIVVSLRRSYQNGTNKSKSADEQRGDKEQDDVPPEPKVSRVTPTNA